MIKKIDFPTDTNHISLPNTTDEIKQQSTEENKLFVETELKKNKGDFETLETLVDEVKRDLIKIFTDPSDGMIVDEVINVNEWVYEVDKKKQQLDQNAQQNYNEITSKLI